MEIRNLRQLSDFSEEMIAALPPQAFEMLVELINGKDRWIVQSRCDK